MTTLTHTPTAWNCTTPWDGETYRERTCDHEECSLDADPIEQADIAKTWDYKADGASPAATWVQFARSVEIGGRYYIACSSLDQGLGDWR